MQAQSYPHTATRRRGHDADAASATAHAAWRRCADDDALNRGDRRCNRRWGENGMCPRRLPRRTGIRVAELSAFGRARQDLFGTCCQVANSGMAIFGRLDMSSRRRTARARILCCERQIFRGAPGRMSPPAHRVRRGYGLFKWRSARKRTKKGNIYWANHLVASCNYRLFR